MKKNILLTSTILGLTSALILTTACSRPSERPSVVDKSISEKLFALSELNDITSATTVEETKVTTRKIYVSGEKKADITAMDSNLIQVKIEGKVDALLKKVKVDSTKKVLDEQLKTGAIALVILKDEIKILKVVKDVDLNLDYDVLSVTYVNRLKDLSKTSDAHAQSNIARQLVDLKKTSPKSLNEKFGLVEITSIKIEKVGILDNNRNDYDEKKSILSVKDKPFEFATHILVGDEVGYVKTAEEIASAKASAAAAASDK